MTSTAPARHLLAFCAISVAAFGACTTNTDDSGPETAPSVVSGSVATTTAPREPVVTDRSTTTTATNVPDTTDGDGPGSPTTTTGGSDLVPLDDLELFFDLVAEGFTQPVLVTTAPDDDSLYVLDQAGVVWQVDGGDVTPLLDISDRVNFSGERGLLGLAFPPDHAETGVFFVNYVSNTDDTSISQFTRDGATADPSSEQVLLEIEQPAGNHNGGMIAFGPDGNLLIGMGDGGRSDDAFGNGQDGSTLLGAILRITPDGDGGYTVPGDNPGVADDSLGWADEVWAIGLRNPWRWTFDGDDLWIGDVGQGAWEEIDRVDVAGAEAAAGLNFGWPLFEGSECYLSDCDDAGLTMPVHQYPHSEGCSITGGVVYRGSSIPELDGHFFFGDFCNGWIRSIDQSGEVREWFEPGSIAGLSGFGTGPDGELYITSTEGPVYRLTRS